MPAAVSMIRTVPGANYGGAIDGPPGNEGNDGTDDGGASAAGCAPERLMSTPATTTTTSARTSSGTSQGTARGPRGRRDPDRR